MIRVLGGELATSWNLLEGLPFLASGWPWVTPFWPSSGFIWLDTVVTGSMWVRTGPDMSKSESKLSAINDKTKIFCIS